MTDALIETDEPAGPADGGDRTSARGRRSGGDGGDPEAPAPAGRARRRWDETTARLAAMDTSSWVTLVVVGACVAFVLISLQPAKLLSDTTPTGGDMSAHVWGPAFLRDHLLTKGRLTGWSPDWYAGFPAFSFYMVPPFLAIALLSLVIPYGVAFKLVAVSGAVSLPVCVWAFGRLNRLPYPAPAFMAVGATIFLFDRSYAIYGGNIASTLAGEFSFAISLSLAVLYLGVLGHTLRTGRHRGWAALLLALAALCHVIPALFAGLGTLLWLALRPGRSRLLDVAQVGAVGGLLAAWWYFPFYGRSAYLNDMGWNKLTDYQLLFTRNMTDSTNKDYPNLKVMVVLAVAGFVVSLLMRQRAGVYLGLLAAASALAFRYLPETRLWNARVLPFYYLSVDVLALLGAALILVAVTRWFAGQDHALERVMQGVVVAGVGLGVYVYLGLPMLALPFGQLDASGTTYEARLGPFGVGTNDISYLRSWADWNFNGLEAVDDKEATDGSGTVTRTYDRSYPEFHDLIRTLQAQAEVHGCGRAMWEYEEDHNRFGSTMEPMMLPFFTDGCIGSMEGLYFEASATTPYHFINSTELSKQGSAPQKEIPYASMPPNQADFDQGVSHLQMLGVKYYLAIDDLMKERSAANPSLRRIADSGPWAVYLVADSELVAPLTAEPAVIEGPNRGHDWLNTSACWYVNAPSWTVPLADDGPASWQRVARTNNPPASDSAQNRCTSPDGSPWGWLTDRAPEARTLPEVKVTNIRSGDDLLSFDVDRPGVPVLVRVSYFPNWEVSGGEGPYRVTPNLMLVVPTGNHVEMHYGLSGLELFSYGVSLIGLAALVLLFRRPLAALAPVGRFWGVVEDPERWAPPPAPDASGAPKVDLSKPGDDGAVAAAPPEPFAPPAPPEPFAPPAPSGPVADLPADEPGSGNATGDDQGKSPDPEP
jgi:hypothetical protein